MYFLDFVRIDRKRKLNRNQNTRVHLNRSGPTCDLSVTIYIPSLHVTTLERATYQNHKTFINTQYIIIEFTRFQIYIFSTPL